MPRQGWVSFIYVVLLAGILLAPGMAMSEETGSAAADNAQKPQAGNVPNSTPSKPQTPQDAKAQFTKLVDKVRNDGELTTLRADVAQDLRMIVDPADPLPSYDISINDGDHYHTICLVEDAQGGAAIVMLSGINGQIFVYKTNLNGVLKQAGKLIKSGHFNSTSVKDIRVSSAMNDFNAEKGFWIEKLVTNPQASNSKSE